MNSDTVYMYLKNVHNDVIAVVNEDGEVVVAYSYDIWGRVTSTALDLQTAVEIISVNPFTYRGYCYDFDLSLYYLQSRYYDPEICRFINADSTDYLGTSGGFASYNLFAYCENDPVNYSDPKGTWGYDVHAGYYKTKSLNKSTLSSVTTQMKLLKRYLYKSALRIYIPYYTSSGRTIFYGTYSWAITAGIKADYAKVIADNCNAVDSKFSPFDKKTQHWHFNTNAKNKYEYDNKIDSRAEIALKQINKAYNYFELASKAKITSDRNYYRNKGLIHLGFALHPIQDYYAHTSDYCIYIKSFNLWSHAHTTDADDVLVEMHRIQKTRRDSLEILKTVYRKYSKILK